VGFGICRFCGVASSLRLRSAAPAEPASADVSEVPPSPLMVAIGIATAITSTAAASAPACAKENR
jgi:hypothetical protein